MSYSFSPFKVGEVEFANPVFLAPMAGITDAVYRYYSYKEGAALTVSEMILANKQLQSSGSNDRKLENQFLYLDSLTEKALAYNIDPNHALAISKIAPRSVQILGYDPEEMANLASILSDSGQVDLIDINMGCPAKKVVKKAAGSALMADPLLVKAIIQAIVKASKVPVTLKMRTGVDREHKNIKDLALMAQDLGIKMLTVHGRTRADLFKGEAEFKTIKEVKEALSIPLVVNGDITNVERFHSTLEATGANAAMIGRASQGNPWLIGQCVAYSKGEEYNLPSTVERFQLMIEHLRSLALIYEPIQAVRIARKHFIWYLANVFPAIYDINNPYLDFKAYQDNEQLVYGDEEPLILHPQDKARIKSLIKGNDVDKEYNKLLNQESIKNEIASWKTTFVRINSLAEQHGLLSYMEDYIVANLKL